MSFSALLSYARGIFAYIPWEHWVVMGVVSLAVIVILLVRNKCSVYGAIALSITVFVGLFLLDAAVVIRYFGIMRHTSGYDLTLDISHLLWKNGHGAYEILSNIAIFVPFGFFFTEFLASIKRSGIWRQVFLATLAAFGFSLFIECLQLVLRVGYFELSDLVMNTVGGFIGAVLAAIGSLVLESVVGREIG